ncbi:hypothetical protein FN846DRAFT_887941 [Sphaerosporella brunnea]|uniref:Uncharacterized protein n=1 Tax=Sphaerosporella brunnea TaxID=1250544 RepID=A0A5J5F409_9PEZI|nr:hypothetical protein FN846DRAFT_887941 [Sphaerosporella brunnea]
MVRTRATPAPLATQTVAQDEDVVDYGNEADFSDVSELERLLAGTASISGKHPGALTPEPAPAPALVTVPIAFLNKMTDTMSALTAHLSTLQGPQALRAQAQSALGTTPPPPPPPPPGPPRVQSIRNRWPAVNPVRLQEILEHRFKVENLLKLNASFVYTPDRRLENIALGSFQIPTTSRNADILREFAPLRTRDELSSALLRYMHYLLDLNQRCTWPSGVFDYEGWSQFSNPELNHLLEARSGGLKRSAETSASGLSAEGPATPAATRNAKTAVLLQQVHGASRRHNRGLCAAG